MSSSVGQCTSAALPRLPRPLESIEDLGDVRLQSEAVPDYARGHLEDVEPVEEANVTSILATHLGVEVLEEDTDTREDSKS